MAEAFAAIVVLAAPAGRGPADGGFGGSAFGGAAGAGPWDSDGIIAWEAATVLAGKRTPAALEALAGRVQEDLALRAIPGGASGQGRFEGLVRALSEYEPAAESVLIQVIRNAEVVASGQDFEGSAAMAAIEALERLTYPSALPALAERLTESGLGYHAAKAIEKREQREPSF